MSQPSVRLWVKYTIFFLNILFLVCGGIFIFVGIWGILSKSTEGIVAISEQIGISLDPFYAFIIIGVVIFVIAFLGAIGSLRENTCLLKSYSGILTLIIALEIGLATLIYFFQDRAATALERIIDQTIRHYYSNPDNQYLVDVMQSNLVCCGATSPNDWQVSEYFNCSSIAVSACSVPFSCCLPDTDGVPNYQCGYGVLSHPENEWHTFIFNRGCVEALRRIFVDNAILLGIIGGGVVIAELAVIAFARMLIEDIKNVKSSR